MNPPTCLDCAHCVVKSFNGDGRLVSAVVARARCLKGLWRQKYYALYYIRRPDRKEQFERLAGKCPEFQRAEEENELLVFAAMHKVGT